MDETGIQGPSTDVPRHLVEVARTVLSDLDLEAVLRRVLDAARDLCDARFAALGVLDPSRTHLERFITSGIGSETHGRIGSLPRGRGVLGELISHPEPLRLREVSAHPHSYGFPADHPVMNSFLGVPVQVRGEPYGNLYLAEKQGAAEFSDDDEQALVLLAAFAGVAIDHARQYTAVQTQRRELETSLAALDATVQIARAVGGETDLEVILQLVAKRGRALVSARSLMIELDRGTDMILASAAGDVPRELIGRTLDRTNSVAGLALRRLATLRLDEEPNLKRFRQHGLGRLGYDATAGLVVPLVFRGQAHGALIALDRLEGGPVFTDEDRHLLEAFAASAATAVATARSVEAERRSQRMAAAEQERARWARELHDETLQNLAALRLALSAGLRSGNPETVRTMLGESIEQLDGEIASLRSLITELRPTALDDLGLAAALEDLGSRVEGRGLSVDLDVELGDHGGARHVGETETAIYRIIQEALTNAIKHGSADQAIVRVGEERGFVVLSVRDNGCGFDTAVRTDGFGLTSMRERAELVGGKLDVESTPGAGTTITARIPGRPLIQAIAS